MIANRFAIWRREASARGQRQLADTLRLLVYKADPNLFDGLDYENDDHFLDPLLFAFFTDPAPTIKLSTLLAGRGTSGPPITLHTPSKVARNRIEVTSHREPLFHRFFLEAGCNPDLIDLAAPTCRHLGHLIKACALLREHCPNLAEELFSVTRRAVLYESEQPYSFATLSAHGAIFLNVASAIDEVFFVEDIAHQAGHVLFNALTLNKERFLSVNPDAYLSGLHGNEREPRTFYAAFHGLFTYMTIGQALSTLLDLDVFENRQAHEALGRLGLILRKFAFDLALLDRPGLFTALGRRCRRYFEDVYTDLYFRYRSSTANLNYCNQPYVFDYRRFVEVNPLISIRSCGGVAASCRAASGAI
jgi:hypothetical protein